MAYKDLDHPVSLKIQSLSNRGRTAARKHFLLPRELAVAVATRYSAVRLEMSALGQKQTSERVRVMSALPPKADIAERRWDVRFVPKADIAASFDHRVGAQQD